MTVAEPLRGDPLAQLIVGRLRLSPLTTGLLALGLAGLCSLLLPAAFGVLSPRPDVQAALADGPNLGILLLVCPAVWGYYIWQMGALEVSRQGLVLSAEDREEMAAALDLIRPRHLQVWGAPIAATVASGLSVISIIAYRSQSGSTWMSYNWQMIAALQCIRWPTLYMATMALNRQLHAVAALNRLLAHVRLKVVAIHPDGAGGLSQLGRYAMASANVVPIAGLYLGLVLLHPGALTWTPGSLILLAVLAYVGLALLLCLWPMYSVHEQMATVKRRLLGDIAALFEEEYSQIVAHLQVDVLPPNAAVRLRAYQRLYRIGEGMPEWPLNLGFLSRLIVTIVLPVVVPLGLNLLVISLLR